MNDNDHHRGVDDVPGVPLPPGPDLEYARQSRQALRMLSDMDRCAHGRHAIDPCTACPGGQSTGNTFAPPGRRIGTDLYGRGYFVPAVREDREDPKHWKIPPEDPAISDDAPTTLLYRERAHLVAFFASCFPSILVPADDYPDWGIVYVNTPTGQMSWHIAPSDLPLFAGVCEVGQRYAWDGHTTEEKYRRFRELLTAPRDRAGAWGRLAERVNGGPLPTDVIGDLAQYEERDR